MQKEVPKSRTATGPPKGPVSEVFPDYALCAQTCPTWSSNYAPSVLSTVRMRCFDRESCCFGCALRALPRMWCVQYTLGLCSFQPASLLAMLLDFGVTRTLHPSPCFSFLYLFWLRELLFHMHFSVFYTAQHSKVKDSSVFVFICGEVFVLLVCGGEFPPASHILTTSGEAQIRYF